MWVNKMVDINNIISLDSKLTLGAHNIDNVSGNVTLRFTNGTERFVPLGQTEPIPVSPHEYSYIDDSNEVLCRLEIRQVQKTLVDETACYVFYIVQGNEATSDELLLQTAQQITDLTTKYSGGEGEIIIPKII
jgi:DNA/RNA-binding domain of Phe-tRNA-synthetase-like protein